MVTFEAFDNAYTAPLHGFAGARDYWRKSSSLPVLGSIRVPVYLLNAADDPFLSESCFPVELARESRLFTLEMPAHGGHVGFVSPDAGPYWSEIRALDFVREAVEAQRPGAGRGAGQPLNLSAASL